MVDFPAPMNPVSTRRLRWVGMTRFVAEPVLCSSWVAGSVDVMASPDSFCASWCFFFA